MASLKPSQARPPSPHHCGLPVLLPRTLRTISRWGPVALEDPHGSRPSTERPPCELGCNHGPLLPDSAPSGSPERPACTLIPSSSCTKSRLGSHLPRGPNRFHGQLCPGHTQGGLACLPWHVGLDYELLTPLKWWNKPLSPNADLCSKVALSLQQPPPPKKIKLW